VFTVRIPFTVPPGTRISEHAATLAVDQITATLTHDGHHHILTAENFQTEADAQRFLICAPAAFAWLLLQKGVAADAALDPQPIRYFDEPEQIGQNLSRSLGGTNFGPVDALIDGAQAAVYLTDKVVKKLTGLQADVFVTIPSVAALQVILHGAGFPRSSDFIADPKLGVALSLYGAFFTETSAKARFLTLIMALESIATAALKPPSALALLARWEQELVATLAALPEASDDAHALQALLRELIFRREDSLRSQIRRLVHDTLSPAPDAADRAREAVDLYDTRSTLVHEGTIDEKILDKATTNAKALVYRTLMARFSRVVQSGEAP
jgi:hypothetical protein